MSENDSYLLSSYKNENRLLREELEKMKSLISIKESRKEAESSFNDRVSPVANTTLNQTKNANLNLTKLTKAYYRDQGQ